MFLSLEHTHTYTHKYFYLYLNLKQLDIKFVHKKIHIPEESLIINKQISYGEQNR